MEYSAIVANYNGLQVLQHQLLHAVYAVTPALDGDGVHLKSGCTISCPSASRAPSQYVESQTDYRLLHPGS